RWPRARPARPDIPSKTSCTCSRSTGSCTCSATTTPSPRSIERCSRCRRDCSPSGSRDENAKVASPMGGDPQLLILAAALVLVAGVLAAAEAALSPFSTSRAEGLAEAGRRGAERVRMIVADSARYLSTALFLRLACELIATILAADVFFGWIETTWLAILAAA